MVQTKQRLLFFLALAALLAIFAGCKAESPTAPGPIIPPTGTSGTTPSGGVTPPSGVSLTLAVSNRTPLIDSTSIITATVLKDGQPVPNGTAVEFVTNFGTFTETADVRALRITTNGVATVTITAPDAGVATINATVNDVTRSTSVTFTTAPVNPPTTSTAPTISSVVPNVGLPAGGQIITITGTNFRQPVRVIFDFGGGNTKEAFVTNVTPTQITAVTPRIDLISGQTQAAAITVIVDAGSTTEAKVTRTAAFTYQLAQLTPVIRAISPTSGPIDGGTRITIIGDAFDAAGGVQVFFNAAQAQVITVNFSQLIVMSPNARDTATNGSGAVTGLVDIRIRNIASGKEVTKTGGFRYTPKVQVTALGPNEGPYTGGTRFTVDGVGFNEPVSVTTAGIGADIIKVTGTQIIAITRGIVPTGCADIRGPVVVTNIDNGDQGNGPDWIYRIIKPTIVGIVPPIGGAVLGGTLDIKIARLTGIPRITIGGNVAFVTAIVTDPVTLISTVTVTVPTALKLDTTPCPAAPGVSAQIPTAFDLTVTIVESSCIDSAPKAVTVNPAGPILGFSPLTGFTPFTATAAVPLPAPGTPFKPATSQQLVITNAGVGTLTVTAITTTGAGCANFTITSGTLPSAPVGQCEVFPITANFTPPPASPSGFTAQCTMTVLTSAGNRNFALSGTVQ